MKTKRGLIADALKEAFKEISQAKGYNTNLWDNVMKRFIFPDDDPELPLISFSAGTENIRYQPGGFQDRFLNITVRCYVTSQDDSIKATSDLIEDVETVVEKNSRLSLADGTTVRDIKITLIDTDQGVLAPLGLAEIQLIVEY